MISKSKFWGVTLGLFIIAVAVAYVARDRGIEVARLRGEAQAAAAKTEADRRQCGLDRASAETRAAAAEARAKDAEARATALGSDLKAWQATAIRAGIAKWFGEHGNCVARAGDGHCTKYKLPDGTVLGSDLL